MLCYATFKKLDDVCTSRLLVSWYSILGIARYCILDWPHKCGTSDLVQHKPLHAMSASNCFVFHFIFVILFTQLLLLLFIIIFRMIESSGLLLPRTWSTNRSWIPLNLDRNKRLKTSTTNATNTVPLRLQDLPREVLYFTLTFLGSAELVALKSFRAALGLTRPAERADAHFVLGATVSHLADVTWGLHLPSLRSLHLTDAHHLNQLVCLASGAHLCTLTISHCPELTDLTPLVHCLQLTHLKLDECSAHTLPHLRRLQTLLIRNSYKLRDLSSLADCDHLQNLRLIGVWTLTTLPQLTACRNLKVVELRTCLHLTDVTGLSPCLRLQSLHISNCFSLKTLPLLKRCTVLQLVHVDNWAIRHTTFDILKPRSSVQRLHFDGKEGRVYTFTSNMTNLLIPIAAIGN